MFALNAVGNWFLEPLKGGQTLDGNFGVAPIFRNADSPDPITVDFLTVIKIAWPHSPTWRTGRPALSVSPYKITIF
jgi:hypothetical protein